MEPETRAFCAQNENIDHYYVLLRVSLPTEEKIKKETVIQVAHNQDA
jgi:hypothetical protein